MLDYFEQLVSSWDQRFRCGSLGDNNLNNDYYSSCSRRWSCWWFNWCKLYEHFSSL